MAGPKIGTKMGGKPGLKGTPYKKPLITRGTSKGGR